MSLQQSQSRAPSPRRSPAKRALIAGVVASAVVLVGCNVAIGGGAVAVMAVVAFVGYGCGEPVDVTVWDRKLAHPVCDATVTAERDGSVHEFSPCYRLHLGDGQWKVKASKPGYVTAVGTVTVSEHRRCSEPTFHSVALTLVPEDEAVPPPAPIAPAPPPAAPSAPPPAATPTPGTAPSAAEHGAVRDTRARR